MEPSMSSAPAGSWSFASSLSVRFTALATLSALLVAAFAFVSSEGLDDLHSSNELLQKTAVIVRRHMLGDMLHDTINADLLAARLAKTTGDTAGIGEAAKEFGEHAAAFKENIDANLACRPRSGRTWER